MPIPAAAPVLTPTPAPAAPGEAGKAQDAPKPGAPGTLKPGEPAGKAPAAAPAKPGEPAAGDAITTPEKPYTIKVNGKDVAVSLDELKAAAQRSEAANERFQEAHRLRQQSEQFIRLLHTNPMAILDNPKMPWKFKELAEQYLLKQIEAEQMTPEQRELHETKLKLKAAEDERKQQQETADKQRETELVKHYNEQYERDIVGALQDSGLPKTRGTVKRIAYYMAEGLKRGVELKAADVLPLVKEDYATEMAEFFGATDGDNITKILGDPVLQKIREAELKRLKGDGGVPPVVPAQPKQANSGNQDPATVVKVDKDTWRKDLDRKFGK